MMYQEYGHIMRNHQQVHCLNYNSFEVINFLYVSLLMFDLIQFYRFFSPIAFDCFFHSLFLPNLGNPKFEVLIVVMILPPCFG